jgi:hypothetical protein
MLSIRIVTAGAIMVVAVTGAQAQTSTNTAPGKPISLLQILEQPSKAKTKPHVRIAAKTSKKSASKKTHLATAEEHPPQWSAQSEIDAVPASVWPASDTSPAGPAEPAPDAPSLSEIVVGGRTVQVASANDINVIDLAADDPNALAEMRSAITASEATSSTMAALTRQDDSEIAAQSWIAELFATLGGAFAAGSVAWFLIGSAPRQRYE